MDDIAISDSGDYICKWIRTKSNVEDVSSTVKLNVRSKQKQFISTSLLLPFQRSSLSLLVLT